MKFKCIKYEVQNGIGWIKFNRPEVRNALSRQTWQELMVILQQTWDDYNIRALVITGEGKSFSSGSPTKRPLYGRDTGSQRSRQRKFPA